ncbi:peroxiredoxin [Actinomadura rugatobispora]|uniref:Peroxiredoxin n=1 Tax=Actinomadura rugatobispora TaxID=1994 RepID=A0ABW0ZXY8_9ACTN|nr:OsmC family peroxiredoxin [Actinomadura rugatobispora]
MPSRDATSRWQGDLLHGKAAVSLDSSNAGDFDVSFPTRAARPDGQTGPEELPAAAHSSLPGDELVGRSGRGEPDRDEHGRLGRGHPGPALDEGFEISGAATMLRAELDGVDAARFREPAIVAAQSCPISKALAGTTITLDAALTS